MLYESAFISSYYKDLWYKVGGDETVYNYTQYIKKIIGKDDKNLLDIFGKIIILEKIYFLDILQVCLGKLENILIMFSALIQEAFLIIDWGLWRLRVKKYFMWNN